MRAKRRSLRLVPHLDKMGRCCKERIRAVMIYGAAVRSVDSRLGIRRRGNLLERVLSRKYADRFSLQVPHNIISWNEGSRDILLTREGPAPDSSSSKLLWVVHSLMLRSTPQLKSRSCCPKQTPETLPLCASST